MALSAAQLSEHLIRSGLLPEEQIKAAAQSVGGLTEESSAEGLAKQLVRDGRLTLFQAQLAVNGKAAALVLGSYLILEKLGQGGMGQVYKARHRTMKREVALKVISAAVLKDETSLRRFQREVEAAAQLNHPNIVTAHDAGEHKGTHFLVMELVKGSDLASVVKKSGPMKASKAVECVLQAARGLAYAHSNGIVHRDIKPANLLLDESGTIKILDMGLARFEEAGQDHASVAGLTGTGMLMGTIDYMSPEQAMDSKTADARSDIYSLGCTLYVLLTGQAVYVEDTVMKRIMAHQAAALPQLPILDSRLQAMFERMIAKKPEHRYQSTAELASELQSWLTNVESDRVKATAEMPVAGGGSWDAPEDTSFRDEANRPSVVTLQTPAEQRGDTKPRGDTTPAASATDATFVPQSGNNAASPLADSPAKKSPSSSDVNTVQRGSQTISGPKKTLKQKGATTTEPIAFAEVSAALNTSSSTSKPSRSKEGGSSSRPQTVSAKSASQPPRRIWTAKLVAACGGGALILMLLGIIVIRITGKDGTESVIKVPEGTEISIDPGTDGRIEITRVPDDAASVDSADRSHQPAWDGWPKDGPAPAIAPFDAAQARNHQEEWAAYLKVPVEYTNSIGMRFMLIPPGEFTMGSTSEEITEALQYVAADNAHWQQCVPSEEPRHKVVLTQPFYLGVNEITQGEYTKVMGVKPSHLTSQSQGNSLVDGAQTADLPVHYVNWNEAAEFCAKLSEQEKLKPFYSRVGETITPLDGTGYRLPSEAEWEFACRAGTVTKYWTGNADEGMLQAGWCVTNSGGRMHAAGELELNPFGLSNIHGNMREWVQDGWDTSYYGQFKDQLAVDPHNPFSRSLMRVNRGGSWHAPPSNSRSADRFAVYPTQVNDDFGIRVLLKVDAVREAMERASSDLTMQPENKTPETAAKAAGTGAAMLASEGTAAGSPAVVNNEAMTLDASGADRSASSITVSVAGTLAPPELRLKERSAELPPFKSVLRLGQPLGEFAAVSSPGKVENIISWSIEPVMHRSMFRCIDVSSEGLIATGGTDNSVRIWTKDWQLLRILPGHANVVCSVAFSPDGKSLASISSDPNALLALWDVSSGQLLAHHAMSHWYGQLAWLPDGKRLARASKSGAEIINPWTGEKRIGDPSINYWPCVAVSPEGGQLIFTVQSERPQIVDASSLKSVRMIDAIIGGVTDWSPDGKWIVLSDAQKTVLLDTRSFQVRAEFAFGGLAKFSPDSTMLAIAGPGHISLRSTLDWSEMRTIPIHVSYDFAWSADGRQLHSSNGSADVATGQHTPHLILSATTPVVSAVSSDGREVATIGNSRLRIFDGANGRLKTESTLEHVGASQLLWQPQGKKILRLLTSHEPIPAPLVLLDSESGRVAQALNGHQGAVWRTAWSPDGSRCASVGEDATCRIWDAASGTELQKLTHSDPLWWVQWSGDGTKVATGSSFSTISVWDVASAKLVREFKTLSKPISAPRTVTAADGPFGFLKGDTQLFYMAGDFGFEVLDLKSGQITSLGQVDHIGGNRQSAAWSKDFGLLGIYDGYNEFHMYAAGDTKPVISIRYFMSPHWLADGRRLLGGDNSSTWLAGYDLRRKRRLGVLIPELAGNSWAVISSDGNYLGADDAKDHLVVVAMHRDGRLLTMTLDEFRSQFKWTNEPEKVRFLE